MFDAGEDDRQVDGVVVVREVAVSAQPFGRDGKVDPAAGPVDYRVKAPVVIYYFTTVTDLEMTAGDLCESIAVRTVSTGHRGISGFLPRTARLDVPTDTIAIATDAGESVAERNGRLVAAAVRATMTVSREEADPRPALPRKGACSQEADNCRYEQRLVRGPRGGSRRGAHRRGVPHVAAGHRGLARAVRQDPTLPLRESRLRAGAPALCSHRGARWGTPSRARSCESWSGNWASRSCRMASWSPFGDWGPRRRSTRRRSLRRRMLGRTCSSGGLPIDDWSGYRAPAVRVLMEEEGQ